MPVVISTFMEDASGLFDAAAADNGLGVERALPCWAIAILKARGALVTVGAGVDFVDDDIGIGDGQAFAADAAAAVAFDHGEIIGPFAVAEIAQHIGHLDVGLICAGLSHVLSVVPQVVYK